MQENFSKYSKLAVGFHGRTYDNRKPQEHAFDVATLKDIAKLIGVQKFIQDTESLILLASHYGKINKTPYYVLTHEPEARRMKQKILNSPRRGILAIEIHPTDDSLQDSRQLVGELQDSGVNAILVYDIVHYMRTLDQDLPYQRIWDQMLKEMAKNDKSLVHLPVGLLGFDSVQFENVSPEMWQDFAAIINEKKNFVILEHQLGEFMKQLIFNHEKVKKKNILSPDNVWRVPEDYAKMVVDRGKRIANTLQENGVLRQRNCES